MRGDALPDESALEALVESTGLRTAFPQSVLDEAAAWVRAPGIDVIGGTLAGLPFVLSGHNRHVAWATTSGGRMRMPARRQSPM